MKSISIIIPVYCGAKYLDMLISEISIEIQKLNTKSKDLRIIESIFVIDEALDESKIIIESHLEQYKWIKVIELSKNFGQHPATIAGILHSSGDWVVTLDEDLQHRPKDILKLLLQVTKKKCDICYAKSSQQTHNSIIKDNMARIFKSTMSYVLSNKNINNFNSFRVIRGSIARAAASICRPETYFDISLSWFSNRVTYFELVLEDNRNKSTDKSGYSVWGLIKHAKRMVMSSKIKLFRIGIPLGIIAFTLSILLFIFAIISTIVKLDTLVYSGWSSIIMVSLFFGGLSTLLMGFILELVSDNSLNLSSKPTYFVVDRSQDVLITKSIEEIINENL